MKSNSRAYGAIHDGLLLSVQQAVDEDVYGEVHDAVYGSVGRIVSDVLYWGVWWAIRSAMRNDTAHPALGDFSFDRHVDLGAP